MSIDKEFKSLEEQIAILEHKGLVVQDKDYARTILLRENYFFLNLGMKSRELLVDHKELLKTAAQNMDVLFFYNLV